MPPLRVKGVLDPTSFGSRQSQAPNHLNRRQMKAGRNCVWLRKDLINQGHDSPWSTVTAIEFSIKRTAYPLEDCIPAVIFVCGKSVLSSITLGRYNIVCSQIMVV